MYGGGSAPWVLATFSPWTTFSSRRNGLPANLCHAPPVRIVTFSDSSLGKSLSVTFQALREFRQRISEGSEAQPRRTSRQACRRHGEPRLKHTSHTKHKRKHDALYEITLFVYTCWPLTHVTGGLLQMVLVAHYVVTTIHNCTWCHK